MLCDIDEGKPARPVQRGSFMPMAHVAMRCVSQANRILLTRNYDKLTVPEAMGYETKLEALCLFMDATMASRKSETFP